MKSFFCKDCEYFHIRQEPLKRHFDAGVAECKKHNLVIDFFNYEKLNKLKCVEVEDDN